MYVLRDFGVDFFVFYVPDKNTLVHFVTICSCILLYSSLDKMHTSNVLVLKVVLLAYHNPQAFLKQRNIIFEEIDGALPSNKDMRNALFEVAGMERNRAL